MLLSGNLRTYRMLMFVTNSYSCHDVVSRHATLLAVIIEEAALPYEKLLLVGQHDMVGAVERHDDCLSLAVLVLAESMWSIEAKTITKRS